jgi:N-acyl-D-aspartate/D-glutamate deacylase
MHDLVIRGGCLVDGSGGERRAGDVAVDAGRLVSVGGRAGPGRREIDARDRLVLPGFVDLHTHYDGQVCWDADLSPSSWHGVTTVVMGNCGVGVAPVRAGDEDELVGLVEGVEDVPGEVLRDGIDWRWGGFPDYLDALEARRYALDVATQVAHGPVRRFVMGDRGTRNEPATADDVARMAEIVREGLLAGALGFSTSRTRRHRTRDGGTIPGYAADDDELQGIAAAIARAGHGVVELVSDLDPFDEEWARLRRVAETGVPLSITLQQRAAEPDRWRRLLEAIEATAAEGVPVAGQVACRPTGLLLGLQAKLHPFASLPDYRALADRPLAERVAALRRPELRERLLADAGSGGFDFARVFPLGDPPDYEPPPEASLAAEAARRGVSPAELAYDRLLERDGHAFLYLPLFNYGEGDLEVARRLMTHPNTLNGLSDGGAHVGMICDASFPTFLLTHWARDRTRGERIPLEQVVRSQTLDTARWLGLDDRGVLAPGARADVLVVDHDRLTLRAPEMRYDLPGGVRRMVQRAEGYVATVVAGEVTREHDEPTGARPGRLVRGPRAGPGRAFA